MTEWIIREDEEDDDFDISEWCDQFDDGEIKLEPSILKNGEILQELFNRGYRTQDISEEIGVSVDIVYNCFVYHDVIQHGGPPMRIQVDHPPWRGHV